MAGPKRGKQSKAPPFVMLAWGVLNSVAYKELGYPAAKALPFFFGKVRHGDREPARYTAQFSFTYTEAKRYGFSYTTFARAIVDLIETGFVDPVRKGGVSGDTKTPNVFCLSERWKKFGTTDFVERSWEQFQWTGKNRVPLQKRWPVAPNAVAKSPFSAKVPPQME